MPHFVEATIAEIIETRAGLQKIRVARCDDGPGDLAYVLTQLIGTVEVDDRVVLNVTAVDLNLGTGGWHFVHWNLARREFHQAGPGHVMKMRYTSLQLDAGTTEEHGFVAPDSLAGTPVVGCLLLSQVAAVAVAYKSLRHDARLALVVHDQNALPIVLSDLVHQLRHQNILDGVVTTGQAFGGDYEAVNVTSGYAVAKAMVGADALIVANGHGSVGTGTPLGFSALSIAAALDDAAQYGGRPILALRWSDADQRSRHQGLSHHSATVMERARPLTLGAPTGTTVPASHHDVQYVDVPDIAELFAERSLDVTTMGRSFSEDPAFFTFAAAAGVVAAHTV